MTHHKHKSIVLKLHKYHKELKRTLEIPNAPQIRNSPSPFPQRKRNRTDDVPRTKQKQQQQKKKKKKKKPRLAAGEAVEKERNRRVNLGVLHCCLTHPIVGVVWFGFKTKKKNTERSERNDGVGV